MLYIKYNSEHPELELRGLLIKAFPNLKREDNKYVVSITASEEEAQYIKERFGFFIGPNWNMSIPWNYKSQSQTWYGDLAKTILANL